MDMVWELVLYFRTSCNCEDIFVLYHGSLHSNRTFPILDKPHDYLCTWILKKKRQFMFVRLFYHSVTINSRLVSLCLLRAITEL